MAYYYFNTRAGPTPNLPSLPLPRLPSDLPTHRSTVGGHFHTTIHRKLASGGWAVSLPYPRHASSSRCVWRPPPRYHLCPKVVRDEIGNCHPLVTSVPLHHDVTSASTRCCPLSPPPHLLASLSRHRVLCHVVTRVNCHVTLPYPIPTDDVIAEKRQSPKFSKKHANSTVLVHFYWSSWVCCACCFTSPCLQSPNSTNRAAAACNFASITRHYTSSIALGD